MSKIKLNFEINSSNGSEKFYKESKQKSHSLTIYFMKLYKN